MNFYLFQGKSAFICHVMANLTGIFANAPLVMRIKGLGQFPPKPVPKSLTGPVVICFRPFLIFIIRIDGKGGGVSAKG